MRAERRSLCTSEHAREDFERLELVAEEVAADGAGEGADLEEDAGRRSELFDRQAQRVERFRDVVREDVRVASRAR